MTDALTDLLRYFITDVCGIFTVERQFVTQMADRKQRILEKLRSVLYLSQIHDVVTEDLTPDGYLTELRDQNVAVHVAAMSKTRIGEEVYATHRCSSDV
jgi:hypothetical protein